MSDTPSTFKQEWEAKKLLKRAKKKQRINCKKKVTLRVKPPSR